MRRRACAAGASGIVVVAEHQSAGRGRRGRAWHSPRGAGIYVSVLRTMRLPVEAITRCTLGAAVAACEACRAAGAPDVAIEWPNDLVHRGRKLGGILCELRSTGPARSDLVVGTGINVLEPIEPRPSDLGERATSLARAGGASMLDREELLVAYLERLGRVLDEIGGPGWTGLRARWTALAPRSSGASVRIATAGGETPLSGTTAGVDDDGALLVRLGDGRTLRVRSVDTVLFEGE